MTSLDEKLREIGARWAADAAPRLATLADMLRARLAEPRVDAEALRATLRLAHALAGGGGTMGFPGVSDLMLALEERLERVLAAGALDEGDRAALAEALAALPDLVRVLERART